MLERQVPGALQVDWQFSEGIVKAGGDKLSLCFQCKTCTGSCPSALASDFRIAKVVRLARLGLRTRVLSGDLIWKCTLCNRCRVRCPEGVDIPGVVKALRALMLERGGIPEAVFLAESAIWENKNVFNMDPSSRMDWVDYTGTEAQVKDRADLVYFVGCVTSYSGRAQSVAHAISSILNSVGEDWTLLKDEWCCGHPLALTGGTGRIKQSAKHNVGAIEATGASRVVTGCPGCYLELVHEYPKVLGRVSGFEVLHFTQLLDHYVSWGLLKMGKFEEKLTYHDPCELGRIGGVFQEPRNVIGSFCTSFLEPTENSENSNCCGAGGFVKGVDLPLASALADTRLEALTKTSAEVVVSACPSCYQNLLEASQRKGNELRVLDLSELVAQQLGLD